LTRYEKLAPLFALAKSRLFSLSRLSQAFVGELSCFSAIKRLTRPQYLLPPPPLPPPPPLYATHQHQAARLGLSLADEELLLKIVDAERCAPLFSFRGFSVCCI
jgi:hypothetical protein